jgi:Uma2 family endonuclease
MPVAVPRYTTDQLRRFPKDGNRYELLDGVLLVTPAPGTAHQVVLARLFVELSNYLRSGGKAIAVSPGEIEIRPRTMLDPDILVFPATYRPGTPWRKMKNWWLAVEAFSRSSRRYDQDFKRDAYLALGVREVWLVDILNKTVLVSRPGAAKDVPHTSTLTWHPPEMPAPLTIALDQIFKGIA